jgi:superfamily II helicase
MLDVILGMYQYVVEQIHINEYHDVEDYLLGNARFLLFKMNKFWNSSTMDNVVCNKPNYHDKIIRIQFYATEAYDLYRQQSKNYTIDATTIYAMEWENDVLDYLNCVDNN